MSDIDALVALTGLDLDHLNTLSPFELRPIVVAQGKQFRNGDGGMVFSVPEVLRQPGSERMKVHPAMPRVHPAMANLPAIPLEDGPGGTFRLFSAAQGVLYTIKVVNTKTEFLTALMTPEIHLVYSGHARYGRGPCFGAGGASPGEEWEEGQGAHPNDDGIFRMGYPFIGVPVGEIIEHGYTANVVTADVKLSAADCDPDLRGQLGVLRRRTLDDIARIAVTTHEFTNNSASNVLLGTTAEAAQAALLAQIRGADLGTQYWTYATGTELCVVHVAGWQDTLSMPDDLGAQTPQCRVFCHFGCSTFHHNYPVVRHIKNWRHEGNERYAYWTTDLSDFAIEIYWLQNLLTYNQYNAGQPLERSLAYAVQRTNANLARDRQRYRVI